MWGKYIKVIITIFLISIITLGIGLMIFFMCASPFNNGTHRDATLFSQYGSFIGGVVGPLFSLASFILLYMTLQAQKEALNNQKEDSERELFETVFFNLLKNQQEITNDIKADFYIFNRIENVEIRAHNIKEISGRDFFMYAKDELHKINLSLKQTNWFGTFNIEEILDTLDHIYKEKDFCEERINKLWDTERIKHTNLIYDISKEKWQKLHNKEGIELAKNIYQIFFHKYYNTIGHYFRNLYHILSFIDNYQQRNIKNLSSEKGKGAEYAQFIQAEMSSYELLLLYYNSLCYPKTLTLVKRYNLLNNLPRDILIDSCHYDENIIKLEKETKIIDMENKN